MDKNLSSNVLGFNKYYPPDYDGEKHKSLNAYRGKREHSCLCARTYVVQGNMPLETEHGRLIRAFS